MAGDNLGLGQLITTPQQRDAIHVAVAPMVAAESLSPGQHVGIDARGNAAFVTPAVGIVDPFLRTRVMPGDKFWLFLYPNTVTSLRHEWTHPAFPATKSEKSQDQIELERFAVHCGLTYDQLIDGLEAGGTVYGTTCYEKIPDEVWEQYESVSGKAVPTDTRAEFFSCSC